MQTHLLCARYHEAPAQDRSSAASSNFTAEIALKKMDLGQLALHPREHSSLFR
jgi:hypothetical protein